MKLKLAIGLLVLSIPAYAGVAGLTMHSRAFCAGINESISWDKTHSWPLSTDSDHWPLDKRISMHRVSTGWENTWRSAAIHYSEGLGMMGWVVDGYHYFLNPQNKPVLLASERVYDCSIYDGWWD